MTKKQQMLEYIETHGMHLVPIPPRTKFPTAKNWGNNCITTPGQVESFIEQQSDWNIGVALGPSGLCSLDIDCLESFAIIMENLGLDAEEIRKYPSIQGREKGLRLLFRVPKNSALKYQKLNWKFDSSKKFTVFELRTVREGDDKQRQDVLPPSIHPDTDAPYKWVTPIDGDIPEPPEWLITIWKNWDSFKKQMTTMDPKYKPPAREEAIKKATPVRSDCVFTAWNQAHDLLATLEQYGYRRVTTKRYISPHSTTNLPGVVLFDDQMSCWIHHASDPLCSEESGRPVGAFDLFCEYEHQGEVGKAAKVAREVLGMPSKVISMTTKKQANGPDVQVSDDADDGWLDFPHRDEKGNALSTFENFEILLNFKGIKITMDEITKNKNISGLGDFSCDGAESAYRGKILSLCEVFGLKKIKTYYQDYIQLIAEKNIVNPVREWILSKPWDGEDRIQALAGTLKPHNFEMAHLFLNKFMRAGAQAMVRKDGIAFKGMLVLQGAQDIGKTSWVFSLVGGKDSPLAQYVAEGEALEPKSKECIMTASSHWLVEAGELGASTKRVDEMKQFIGRKTDKYVKKYSNDATHNPRRFMLIGTVNESEFLRDKTGSVRFLTVRCTAHLDFNHNIDMQQAWAQAWFENNDQGRPYFFTRSEVRAISALNLEHEEIDSTEEIMLHYFDVKAPMRPMIYTAGELLQFLKVPINYENRKAMKAAMVKHFGEYKTQRDPFGALKKGVLMPEPLTGGRIGR